MAWVAGVAAAVGSYVVTSGIGAVLLGIIKGAVIGACVGGLVSAVTGGDIKQGILYGAVGGAVLGGISAYSSLGSSAAASGSSATGSSATTNLTTGTWSYSAATPVSSATNTGTQETLGSAIGKQLLTTAGQKYLADDAAEDAEKEAEKAAERNAIEAEKNRKNQIELAKINAGASTASAQLSYKANQEALAEKIREYNLERKDYLIAQENSKEALSKWKLRGRSSTDEDSPSTDGSLITDILNKDNIEMEA